MEKKIPAINMPGREAKADEQIALEGIPVYPAGEDIYRQSKEEQDIDPENIATEKVPNEADEEENDLDIPGAELDDDDEIIGSEDEENNYYSIGGDEHNDLDEDNGE
jgi:hypothetical protein